MSIEIETDELCSYGCNQPAKYINKSGNYMCAKSANSCPSNKKKNSEKLKLAYDNGVRISQKEIYKSLSDDKKNRMNHNKNKRYADFSYNGKGQHKNALLLERGHQCEKCFLTEWLDKPITLELDHIDGDRKNNKQDNLRLLCPNCHSQTPTWRRAKDNGWKQRKYTDDEYILAIKESYNLNQALNKLGLRYGSAQTLVKIMGEYLVNFKSQDHQNNQNNKIKEKENYGNSF